MFKQQVKVHAPGSRSGRMYFISWWVWEILDKHPALVRYYSGECGCGVLLRFCVIIIFCALN